jgi:hypothetical protein
MAFLAWSAAVRFQVARRWSRFCLEVFFFGTAMTAIFKTSQPFDYKAKWCLCTALPSNL